jgi:hypothetical protein
MFILENKINGIEIKKIVRFFVPSSHQYKQIDLKHL